MNKIAIEAKRDFLERLASAPPLKAIGELIWNGLDAGAEKVEIKLVTNSLDGLEEIRVRDDGSGINHGQIQTLFGNLGASWKMKKNRHHGRSLHGKSGQGRFKAFALGGRVEWNTVYEESGSRFRFQVSGRATALDDLRFSGLLSANGDACGTEVVISEIEKSFGSLLGDKAAEELAKHFAVYLSQYPEVKILYDGALVDPGTIQNHKQDLPLEEIQLSNGKMVSAAVTVVEWSVPTKRVIHLCDADGVSLHEAEAGVQVRAPGFEFTAYVKSDLFRDLDKQGQLCLDELNPDVSRILHLAKQRIKGYFRQRLAEQQGQIVERWKSEQIYPFEDKSEIDPVENAERQVFDIVAVNVEAYLPAFEESDTKSKRFMFRLLAQALRQNPESVQQIITEVLSLKKEEQADLAELLDKTPLSAIISTAKTVSNRLDFLVALENLLFDKETKKKLLERDQLHKILEKEAWIFQEEFALSGSEERLEEVLQKHIGCLGKRQDGETEVTVGDDGTGRIDLMLSRVVQPRHGEYDYLIVELKRPTKKIDDDVITQAKKYAMAVSRDERFHGIPAKWTFIAVSNEFNEFARQDSSQPDRPQGQVFRSSDGKVTVWIREWADLINSARSRLSFLNSRLAYEANRESSKAYLEKTHAKFIPVTMTPDLEEAEPEDSL